ncbi:hypothetical protein [Tabrizicola oligotrophica]|uniref:Transferrin-binding protein B C-lobe/N-lobe beta barrel domain-containing protein n=1 Tax=Tabrizicola oligotrophica TaxID=2710650 RepID=A0A6M0QY23_9RHOB|nr:hypothetical protein [Tabrizicola oligotrophica]NEY91664.1 hypothetical protein [Tabrizicola oligotrophica]
MGGYRAALAALLVVAACGGNPFVPDPVDPTDPTDPTPSEDNENAVQDLRGFAYDGTTLSIDMAGVSSSGQFGTFVRRPSMDIPRHGTHPRYLAYEFQETNMTRSYLAYVAENQRETLLAVAAADGGQFNEHNGGGGWVRLTGYTRPTIASSPSPTPGPEAGTFSYYGAYAGVFVPGLADADGAPRPDPLHPQEPLGVRGQIQVNAQFTNTSSGDPEVVEGQIVNRQLFDRDGNQIISIDVSDGSGGFTTIDTTELQSLVLRETAISDNGTFLGTVEYAGTPDSEAGEYDGAFGGTGASDVAGVIWVNPIDGQDGIWEYGAFNLPRCDLAGASPICDPR